MHQGSSIGLEKEFLCCIVWLLGQPWEQERMLPRLLLELQSQQYRPDPGINPGLSGALNIHLKRVLHQELGGRQGFLWELRAAAASSSKQPCSGAVLEGAAQSRGAKIQCAGRARLLPAPALDWGRAVTTLESSTVTRGPVTS